MKDKKIKIVKTIGEIFHLFANQTYNKARTSNYKYEIDGISLFKNNIEIARIYSKIKKIVLVQDYNDIGSFGNGYSSWEVKKAFNNDWNIIEGSITKFSTSTSNKDIKNETFKEIIDYYINKIVDDYSNLNDVINDNNFYDNYCLYSIKRTIESFIRIKDILHIPISLIKKKYNNKTFWFIRYKGWSSYNDNITIDNRPYDWLYKDLFTDEELEVLNCKNWIHKWIYNTGSILTKQEKIDLYKDVDRRKEYEGKVEERRKLKAKQDAIRIEKIRKDNYDKQLLDIDRWLKGERIGIYRLPIHLRIIADNNVETSRNAIIPLSHCKLLYLKFRNCINSNTEWISNGSSIKIGYYHVSKIGKDDKGWFIKAGCHTIRETEIEKFIKQYDLKW